MNQTPKHSFSRNVVSYTHTCYSSTNQTSPKPWELIAESLAPTSKVLQAIDHDETLRGSSTIQDQAIDDELVEKLTLYNITERYKEDW